MDFFDNLDSFIMDNPLDKFGGLISKTAEFDAIVTIIYIIVIIGAFYTFYGFVVMYIGRKTGLQKDWMAFVPFARTIYRLKMVEEKWWKMFFLEWTWLYASILTLLIEAISNNMWSTFAAVVSTMFMLCAIGYNVYYRYKFYKAFNILPVLALTALSTFFLRFPVTIVGAIAFGSIATIFDILIAFTSLFEFCGKGVNQSLTTDLKDVFDPNKVGQLKTGSITGLSGMYANQKFDLADNDELIIGRDSQFSNIILDQNADKVSRKHCGIIFDSKTNYYLVTDYSTNGTFVDGGNRLVANIQTTLPRGAVVALGSRENWFKLN